MNDVVEDAEILERLRGLHRRLGVLTQEIDQLKGRVARLESQFIWLATGAIMTGLLSLAVFLVSLYMQ